MWHIETWFSGGLDCAGIRVGLDVKGLFQPKQSSDYLPWDKRASLAFPPMFVVMTLWLFLDYWARMLVMLSLASEGFLGH